MNIKYFLHSIPILFTFYTTICVAQVIGPPIRIYAPNCHPKNMAKELIFNKDGVADLSGVDSSLLFIANVLPPYKGDNTNADKKDIYNSCCGIEPVSFKKDSVHIFVPNIFTPNNDGVNDFFLPSTSKNIISFYNYLIYTTVGDTILFDNQRFGLSEYPESYVWDENRSDGTPFVGPFNYEFTIILKDGNLYRVTGRACRVICGEKAQSLKNKPGCFYPVQTDGAGHPDKDAANQETGCFN